MKRSSVFAAVLAAHLAIVFPGPQVMELRAADAEIHAFIAGALTAPVRGAVLDGAEAAVGKKVTAEFGASLSMAPKIAAGAACDVAVITPEPLAELIASGRIVKGSRVDVARVSAAVGQTGGVKQDISTMAGLKKALLGAKSIRYTANGATRPSIMKAFETLGIKAEMDAKTLPRENDPLNLGPGEYDLYLHLTSEVLPQVQRGMMFLGEFPAEVNIPVVISAGVCSSSNDPIAAKKFIDYLMGPALDPGLKANGMQRPR